MLLTLLLSDIERSSEHWLHDAAAMSQALARHDAIILDAVTRAGGRLIKERGEGDSLFAVFGSAEGALQGALDSQRSLIAEPWPREPLRVRMVVHTCEAEMRDGDIYGVGVNEAARLRNLGHGGQILVSSTVFGLLGGTPAPAGGGLRRAGEFPIPPTGAVKVVYQFVHPDLPAEFPPLRAAPAIKGLPHIPDELVGRDREIRKLAELLASGRLVTLVGSGGVGKSHLAVVAAAKLRGGFRDGVVFVPLDAVAAGEDLGRAFTEALGVRNERSASLESAVEGLRERESLLLVDNCEHVLEALSDVIERILHSCPQVRILATSHESLGVNGERVLPVRGLPWPAAGTPTSELEGWPATQLFLDRALHRNPSFHLDPAAGAAVRDIAELVEGHPLAIGLAAAQLHFLSPLEILERLHARPSTALGNRRARPQRHRGLQHCLGWSYDLLPPSDQDGFDRIGIFASRFRLADAQSVMVDLAGEPVETLSHLVSKSLVTVDQSDGRSYYALAPVVRDYARSHLRERNLWTTAADRHSAWCQTLVEANTQATDKSDSIKKLRDHLADIRAALTHLETGGRWEDALRLAGKLRHFWYSQGSWVEGRSILGRLLDRSADVPVDCAVRAEALMGLGTLAGVLGEPDAERHHHAAVEQWRACGNELGVAWAMNNIGMIAFGAGRLDQAREAYEGSLEIKTRLGVRDPLALLNLGLVLWQQGELNRAEELLGAAEQQSRAGSPVDLASCLLARGAVALARARYSEAMSLLTEALTLAEQLHDKQIGAEIRRSLATTEFELGRPRAARAHFAEAVKCDRAIGNDLGVLETLVFSARSGLERPTTALAARLLAAHDLAVEGKAIWLGAEALATLSAVERQLGAGAKARGHLHQAIRLAASGGYSLALIGFLEDAAILCSDCEAHDSGMALEAAATVARERVGAPRPTTRSIALEALFPRSEADVSTLLFGESLESASRFALSELDRITSPDA